MYVELTSGQDSFRATPTSPRRNVSVRLFTNTPDEGVMPLFAAFQKKLPGYKESRIVMNIPATENFAINDAGKWFRNRYEIAAGIEILIEYHHRDAVGFGTETEYLLIKTGPEAPLNYVRLGLDPHPLSAVPYVFFEGRFSVVTSDDELADPTAWLKHLGITAVSEFTMIVDPNISEPGEEFFKVKELERANTGSTVHAQVINKDGKRKLLRIKRGRRIKTR